MPKKEEKLFQIKDLSERQIRVMKDALEMYTRMGLLQFDKVIDHHFGWGKNDNFSDTYMDKREEIEMLCARIKDLIVSGDDEFKKYPKNTHWSLGIGGEKTSTETAIAYEIEKEIEKVTQKKARGSLDLTDETLVRVSEQNLREEKLKQIIKKLKD